MTISKLSLYNNALLLIGERPLVTDTDATETRRRLDIVFDQNAVEYCLEIVKPNFAILTDTIASDGTTVEHSMTYSYTLPASYITTHSVFADTDMDSPVNRYLIEYGKLYSELPILTHRYVYNFAGFLNWTASFANVVSAYLAKEIAPRFAPQKLAEVSELFTSRVQAATSLETLNAPLSRPKSSTFTLTNDYRNVYNAALNILGLEHLITNTDDSDRRSALDSVMNAGAVDYMLDMIKPKFAIETNKLTSSVVSIQHDLDNVFTLPADYISMIEVHADPLMDEPISRYIIEGRTIACSYSTIYIRFVSNAQAITVWSSNFKQALSTYLADQIKNRFVADISQRNYITDLLTTRTQTAIDLEGYMNLSRAQRSTFTLTDDYRNIYNGALNLLGLEQIVSNDDDSERRAALDTVLNSDAVNYLYELAQPRFALETNKLTASVTSAEHDLDNVFTLPTDYLSMVEVHADPLMDEPITRYIIEGRTIACSYSTIYIRFVSSSPTSASWTPAFKQLLSAYMAEQVKNRFTDNEIKMAGISTAFTSRLAFIQQQEQAKEAGKRSSRSTATLSDAWRKVYNNALLLLGLDQIVSNDDDSDRRSKLDVALGTGVVETVMEDLSWTFGITSNKLNYNPSLEPEWGFSRVFDKPADLHRIDGLFHDEYFNVPLKEYEDEGDRWYCDVDEIYVKYVKTSYLTTPSNWPQYFSNIVAAELACRVGPALPGANIKHALDMKQIRQREAESTDAMSGPPQRIKTGSWVRSRVGTRGNSYSGRP